MQPQGSLPHSQLPATCLYPEPARSSPYSPTHFLKTLIIVLPSTPWSSNCSLSLSFPHQNPVYNFSLPHTCYMPCPSHLDLIARTIFGEQYRSLSSSLCYIISLTVAEDIVFLPPNFIILWSPNARAVQDPRRVSGNAFALRPLSPLVDAHWGSFVFFVV